MAPGFAAITGTGTHKSIEGNMLHKLETKEMLSIEEVKDIARDAVVSTWQRDGARMTPDEEAQGIMATLGQAIDMAVSLSALHHDKLAPDIEPLHVERKFVLELPNYPMDLGGTIDLQDTTRTVRDAKTAARLPQESAIRAMLQPTLYSLAVLKIDGFMPNFVLDYLVKTSKPKAVSITTERTDKDFQMLLHRLENMVTCIERGDFPPTSPENWQCAERWCGFAKTCRYWGGQP